MQARPWPTQQDSTNEQEGGVAIREPFRLPPGIAEASAQLVVTSLVAKSTVTLERKPTDVVLGSRYGVPF